MHDHETAFKFHAQRLGYTNFSREHGRYCHQPLNELRAMYDAAHRDGRLTGRAEVARAMYDHDTGFKFHAQRLGYTDFGREHGRYCHQPLNELRAMYDAAHRDGRLTGRAEVALSKGSALGKGGVTAFDD
ncbi:hypothetical protein [Azotobacter salinestris]|uniref:hypothetical protein n=1 Tax=Azotobacter salinestris TaxID=69964 RepID=UPI0032E039AE